MSHDSTPGPWGYEEETGEIFYDDKDGEQVYPMIANVYGDNTDPKQERADGYLIAAAPDMRAALSELVRVLTEDENYKTYNPKVRAALLALDKAKVPEDRVY